MMRFGLPPAAASAVALALLASAGGSASGAASVSASGSAEAAPSFAALSGSGPTGLRLGPPVSAGASGVPQPTFPATPPAEAADWPVAGTVRKLAVSEHGLSAWIARSNAGGICVLLYDGVPVEGVAAVYAGCSTAAGIGNGAAVEVSRIPGKEGETIAVGVVPDGVTSVSERLEDGSTESSPVSGNAWVRIGGVAAAAGAEPIETRGG